MKEASETKYWIELIIDNNLASKHKFSLMLQEIEVIIKILVAITKKLKEKEKSNIYSALYYLLPTTHYPLPTTYYLLPTTHEFLKLKLFCKFGIV